MTRSFEYWFDFSCPYAYLGLTRVEALAARVGATLDPRPMLLGGVFRARETPQKLFETLGPAKAAHQAQDLTRHARLYGVELKTPAGHPLRTVNALRALLAVGPPFMPLAHRFFRAYWVEGIDLSTDDGVRAVLSAAGHDAAAVMAKAQSEAIKEELRRRTDEAIARGVFGAPSFFVDGALYYGQDRLAQVERALGGDPPPLASASGPARCPIDLWFDYSSPYSYFGVMSAEAILGPEARWRPMLLGGVFKEVGQANVPLLAQSEAKQAFLRDDQARCAAALGVPFTFPSRFPMSTVLALRVTLAAQAAESPKGRALVQRIYRAYWGEDRDISQPELIRDLCNEMGFDGPALIEAAGTQPIKDALKEATSGAVKAGVFGAPTTVVHLPGREPSLYWGHDRMEIAALAARGVEAAF